MLIELWEKFRGYDKWIQAKATIRSAQVNRTAHSDRRGRNYYTYASHDLLVWTDALGQQRTAEFKVDDESALYQLTGGESLVIRYNAISTDQFYCRELAQSKIRRFWQITRNVTIGLVVFGFFIWLSIATH
jgi:hypothetical protein